MAKLLPATQHTECVIYSDFTLSALNITLGVDEDNSTDEPMFKCLQVGKGDPLITPHPDLRVGFFGNTKYVFLRARRSAAHIASLGYHP